MPNRLFRVAEGAFVSLFFLQALRLVVGRIIATVDTALRSGDAQQAIVALSMLLFAGSILAWLAPKQPSRAARLLCATSILVAVSRLMMTLPDTPLRLYSGLVIVALAGFYAVALVRVSWQSWVLGLGFGLMLDQLSRSYNTYGYTFNTFSRQLEVRLSATELFTLRASPLSLQVLLSLVLIALAVIVLRNTENEPYEPATLTLVSGLGYGGFLALQLIVLANANVIARWAQVPRSGLVFWLLFITGLGLLSGVRKIIHFLLLPFAPGLRGLLWLLVFIVLLIIGYVLQGPFAATCLLLAQLFAIVLLWSLPQPTQESADQAGLLPLAYTMAVVLLMFLLFAYHLSFGLGQTLFQVPVTVLPVLVVATVMASLPRLVSTEYKVSLPVPVGIISVFAAPLAVAGLIIVGTTGVQRPLASGETIRVATFNLNRGQVLTSGTSPTEMAAFLASSRADIIILQEVDTGSLTSFGADQVDYLAVRLGMYSVFRPTTSQLYGIAILSRWPLFMPDFGLLPGASANQAVALRVIVQDQATGRTVQVVGSQLVAGTEEERVQQYAGLVNFIVEEPRELSAVVGIDLGTPPDLLYDQITLGAGYDDPIEVLEVDAEATYTFPVEDPIEQRDHVFSFGLQPLTVTTVPTALSDHALLVVELGWPR